MTFGRHSLKRIHQSSIISIAILFLALMAPVFGSDSHSGSPPDWCRLVNSQVQRWVDSRAVMGAELLIIQCEDTVLHAVYGWDDIESGEQLEFGQIFRVYSMTKPFVGTVILMLEEEGLLELNDRASKYLDCFRTESCESITIRQLLNHTAGFTQPAYPRGSIDLYTSLAEAVGDLAVAGPAYEPGTEYHYSDGHSATLGLIIGEITGKPVEEVIRERIFVPLGMRDTYCLLSDSTPDRERICNTYFWRDGRYQKLWDNEAPPETPFFRASGGIFSTISDYAKFLALWLQRGQFSSVRLLGETSVKKALTHGVINESYGLHWQLHHPAKGDSALPVFGHGGSSGTLALALPEQQAMVLYFTQSRGTLTTDFLTTLILRKLNYTEDKNIQQAEVSDRLYESYTGDYMIRDEVWSVVRNGNGISLNCNRLVPISFLPISDSVFVQPYMDWAVTFVERGTNAADKFIFRLGEREVEAVRKEP